MLMFTQEMKKDNISLEDECEGLTFIQVACRDQGITEGMKEQVPVEQHVGLAQSLANVQEKCQRQADGIAQKRQVQTQISTAAQTGTGRHSGSSSVLALVVIDLFLPPRCCCRTPRRL